MSSIHSSGKTSHSHSNSNSHEHHHHHHNPKHTISAQNDHVVARRGDDSENASKNKPTVIKFHPDLLAQYDNVIFDLDGVVWHGYKFFEYSHSTLTSLQKTFGKNVFFCTNNSTRHRGTYPDIFAPWKLDLSHLYTCASTAASYASQLLRDKKHDKVLLIGEAGLEAEFRDAGVNFIHANELVQKIEPTIPSLASYQIDPSIKVVVSGMQATFSWVHCSLACLAVRENDAVYIATNRDATFPCGHGRELPGAGSVVNSIEHSCGKRAETMGKPHRFMIEALCRDHQINLSRTLMVGDRIDTDMQFGRNWGMDTMLVFTGVTKKQDALQHWNIITPDEKDLADARKAYQDKVQHVIDDKQKEKEQEEQDKKQQQQKQQNVADESCSVATPEAVNTTTSQLHPLKQVPGSEDGPTVPTYVADNISWLVQLFGGESHHH